MRFLPTRVHGILDYLVGILLVVAPVILGFDQGGMETLVPIVLGFSTILYSLLTDYEWGLSKHMPMMGHLWLDGLSGLVLAASPWLFNFHDRVFLPHLLVGLFEIGASLFTKQTPNHTPAFRHEPNEAGDAW